MTEAAAKEQVLKRCGFDGAHAERWRGRSWKERLDIEESSVGFDTAFAESSGYTFSDTGGTTSEGPPAAAGMHVELLGVGPKMLISDASTATQRTIRWRLRVRGNTAVEFGVVPADPDWCRRHSTLHKMTTPPERDAELPAGFSSQITAGSNLAIKVSVMRSSVVELLARRGRLEVLLHNRRGEKEMHWINGHPVSRLYRGPETLRFEVELGGDYDVKLALTSWAKGAFEILHDLPPPPPVKEPPSLGVRVDGGPEPMERDPQGRCPSGSSISSTC